MREHQSLAAGSEFPAARIRSTATNSAVRITPKPAEDARSGDRRFRVAVRGKRAKQPRRI